MGAVALAIDVGSWYQRSSQLQKAADAAVLSGVAIKVGENNLSMAEYRAREIIAQNGIDLNEEITLPDGTRVKRIQVEIIQPRADQYKVQITDRRMDVYFGRAVGIDSLSRNSTAQLNVCDAECYQKVEIPKPHLALTTTGTGDGYLPIYVEGDSRLFAINHKVNSSSNTGTASAQQLVCIDRYTNAVCAGYPRSLQTAAGSAGTSGTTNVFTNNRVTAVVIGRKIFLGAQGTVGTKSYFGINCWDTSTNTSCGFVSLAELTKGSGTYPNRGGGPALVNGKLYAFTDNGKMHCVNPADMSVCSSYGTSSGTGSFTPGLPSGLETGATVYPDYVMSQSGVDQPPMPMDHEVIGTKIFWTLHYRTQKWASGAYIGSVMHCWDVTTTSPCSGFGVKVLPWRLDTTSGGDGSVFVRYSTGLTAEGVCVMKMGNSYKCYSTTGADMGSLSSALHTKFSSNLERYQEFYFEGRTYFAGQYNLSEVYCWNWATATSCGNQNWKTSPNSPLYNSAILSNRVTGDYGYTTNGRCLIGMGHTNVWWTFGKDMGPCRDTSVMLNIKRCLCDDGKRYWGDIQINGVNLAQGGDFTNFTVTVKTTTGTVLLTQQLVGTDGILQLSQLNVSTNVDELVLDIEIQSNAGFTAWAADGSPPEVEVRYRSNPSLVN